MPFFTKTTKARTERDLLPADWLEAAFRIAERTPKPPPFPQLAEDLLFGAWQSGAAELLIEPERKGALVRFRIDGLVHDILRYPPAWHEPIVEALKRLARLRTDERFAAQEGTLREDFENEAVDIRLGFVPMVEGEKVLARILTERRRGLSLGALDLPAEALEAVERALGKEAGLILAAGPAHAGKTATLYAMLRSLDAGRAHIATIEDPIEDDLHGATQLAVDVAAGLTFASGARAVLEQDPDVLLIGEIRDEETAGLAFEAAAQGHLVLAGLIAPGAAEALARLLDRRVDPYVLASSLELIVAQRLVRRICGDCRRTRELTPAEAKTKLPAETVRRLFGTKKTLTVSYGAKCVECRFTGYRGRFALFEWLEMTEPLRKLVLKRANAETLRREAARLGMRTMFEDGLQKVLDGKTTIEEILRP